MYACLAVTCHLHFWQNDRDLLRAATSVAGNTGPGGTDTEIRVSTESRPWRRKFSRRSSRDSNPRPFNHESGALTTELSPPPGRIGLSLSLICHWTCRWFYNDFRRGLSQTVLLTLFSRALSRRRFSMTLIGYQNVTCFSFVYMSIVMYLLNYFCQCLFFLSGQSVWNSFIFLTFS